MESFKTLYEAQETMYAASCSKEIIYAPTS